MVVSEDHYGNAGLSPDGAVQGGASHAKITLLCCHSEPFAQRPFSRNTVNGSRRWWGAGKSLRDEQCLGWILYLSTTMSPPSDTYLCSTDIASLAKLGVTPIDACIEPTASLQATRRTLHPGGGMQVLGYISETILREASNLESTPGTTALTSGMTAVARRM